MTAQKRMIGMTPKAAAYSKDRLAINSRLEPTVRNPSCRK